VNKLSVSKRTLGSALVIAGIALGMVSPAQAVSPITLADIYNPAKILRIDFTLPAPSVTSLNNQQTLKVYVPGKLKITSGSKTSGDLDISLHLKGSTSLFTLDQTPSFKVKFKKNGGAGYLGLRKLTLNAMTQDGSKVHEFAAYSLFNAVGLPAEKTGWAHIYVNGVDKGLYVNVETPDEVFIQKRFKDITQHIYEGIWSQDLTYGNDDGDANTGSFLVDYGWKTTPNKSDLAKLFDYTSDINQASWYKNLPSVFDRAALIKFLAVENFIGHWDGYSGPDINNYFLRSNTRNKFTFIPWGTDQTFGANNQTAVVGDDFNMSMLSDTSIHPWTTNAMQRGQLYVQCINYKTCRTEYLKDLKSISATVTSMKLTTRISAAIKLINPIADVQFGTTQQQLTNLHTEQAQTLRWIVSRQAQVATLLKQNGIK